MEERVLESDDVNAGKKRENKTGKRKRKQALENSTF